MKTKLLLFIFIMSFMLSIQQTQAQTLSPGDISIFWYQADTPDKFAFTTFVELNAGTEIIFTDCGAVPGGTFDPLGCGEGATVYTVPVGGIQIGEVVLFDDASPAPEFSDYGGDAIINGSSGLGVSTGGDSITVIQGTGVSPSFIFMINGASTGFTGDDTSSTTETNLFTGLTDVGLPRTAVGVGAGPGASQEFDNAIYNGTYTFATINDAKIALTDPANYIGVNTITTAPYPTLVAAIPTKLTITSLSTDEFELGNSIVVTPNPSNGNITIKNSGVAIDKVVVTDVNGRTISSYDLQGTTVGKELNLSSYVLSGMYFMSISSGDRTTVKKLIIK
ncbi:T9SS type A sorting domain-containing protein [Winogradskyella sp.]|uniref:T9SS type A sorting domain-containing protein n=1 Tax=Winogradskyella sp. TaxID=1883156 RepID=UPI0025E78594|nr:T9SS type A sorting domain-containing protein [Winogradskyella sp.]